MSYSIRHCHANDHAPYQEFCSSPWTPLSRSSLKARRSLPLPVLSDDAEHGRAAPRRKPSSGDLPVARYSPPRLSDGMRSAAGQIDARIRRDPRPACTCYKGRPAKAHRRRRDRQLYPLDSQATHSRKQLTCRKGTNNHSKETNKQTINREIKTDSHMGVSALQENAARALSLSLSLPWPSLARKYCNGRPTAAPHFRPALLCCVPCKALNRRHAEQQEFAYGGPCRVTHRS